jgi:hypothetical protein
MGCVSVCSCNVAMKNTGVGCITPMEATKKALLMPYFDSDGNQNYIDLTSDLDAAYFSGLINEADSSKRLFPLPEFKDVNDSRAEAIVQTFADGSTEFLAEGIRSFDALIVGKFAAPILIAKIKAAQCNEMGVFLVDRKGSIIGIPSADKTKLYPIRLDSGSISAILVNTTYTTKQAIKVSWKFHPDEEDSCLGMITGGELAAIESPVNALLLKGLYDVHAAFSAITTGGFTVKLTTDFGTPLEPTVVTGLVVGDFAAYNVTDSSAIGLTGTGAAFSEPTDGTYVFEYATADDTTSGDKVRITPTKTGYDFSEVIAAPFTTP